MEKPAREILFSSRPLEMLATIQLQIVTSPADDEDMMHAFRFSPSFLVAATRLT